MIFIDPNHLLLVTKIILFVILAHPLLLFLQKSNFMGFNAVYKLSIKPIF